MAWNQPGGPNNPWGRRPGQGGAPDLDERLKSWQRRLEALLRPAGHGGDSNSVLWYGVLLLIVIWGLTGVYQVAQAERGIIQRFGRLGEGHCDRRRTGEIINLLRGDSLDDPPHR